MNVYHTTLWFNNLEKLKEYINKNHKLPIRDKHNLQVSKLKHWLNHQRSNYNKYKYAKKNNQKLRYPMKNDYIRYHWKEFLKEHEEYFYDNFQKWHMKLNELKKYIDEYQKHPINSKKDTKSRILYNWLNNQYTTYYKRTKIMKNKEIYDEWEQFVKQNNSIILDTKYFRQKILINYHNEYMKRSNDIYNISDIFPHQFLTF